MGAKKRIARNKPQEAQNEEMIESTLLVLEIPNFLAQELNWPLPVVGKAGFLLIVGDVVMEVNLSMYGEAIRLTETAALKGFSVEVLGLGDTLEWVYEDSIKIEAQG